MTNVDDLYAPHDIEEGTVIFTENDLPDAQLQRSDDPNCEVVEGALKEVVNRAWQSLRSATSRWGNLHSA